MQLVVQIDELNFLLGMISIPVILPFIFMAEVLTSFTLSTSFGGIRLYIEEGIAPLLNTY